jgi:hypothetical protein
LYNFVELECREVAMAMRKKSKAGETTNPAPKTRDQKLAEKQALAMWALLGAGGGAFGGELIPKVEKAERAALEKAGLVTVEKRQRSYWLDVTDKGWHWAEGHLGDALPDKSFGGAFVLRTWLTRLQAFMQVHEVRLADVLGPQTKSVGDRLSTGYAELRERIRAVYLEIAGGFNKRALLKDIREHLRQVDRSALDDALKRMQREEDASLMQLDNRVEITEADRAAALYIGSEPRHILWISR